MQTFQVTFQTAQERDEAAKLMYEMGRFYYSLQHKAKRRRGIRASERAMMLADYARKEKIFNELGRQIGGERLHG